MSNAQNDNEQVAYIQQRSEDTIAPCHSSNKQNENVCPIKNTQDATSDPILNDIQKLRSKLSNVKSSIKLSSSALTSNNSTWEQNCLNAVLNCAKSWNSILIFHNHIQNIVDDHDGNDTNVEDPTREEEQIRVDAHSRTVPGYQKVVIEISLELFMLIQVSLQSGPLNNSKPGYFKRCGGTVAGIALRYLLNLTKIPLLEHLWFSERQMNALNTWINNASKAAEKNDLPSKSATRKQTKQQAKQLEKKIQSAKKKEKKKLVALLNDV